jgi:uncharacterized protein
MSSSELEPSELTESIEAELPPAELDTPAQAVEAEPLPPPEPARPVEGAERLTSVDVLRGFALLGILAMNIVGFGWPMSVYETPTMAPDADWADIALWGFNHIVFDTKMMTLFSMLFGAGLVLMGERAERRGSKLLGVYYRRVFWLLVIGLIHAYLIWDGDILVWYALCGFLLYPFRRLGPRTLIALGLCLCLLAAPLLVGFRLIGVPYMRTTAARAEAERAAGRTPSRWTQQVHKGWTQMNKREMPKRETLLKQIATHRSDYPTIVADRAGRMVFQQPFGFLFVGWWLAGGRMLLGMGLMKLGVFGAGLSRRTYWITMCIGYGIGLPVMLFDVWHQIQGRFFLDASVWHMLEGWPLLTFVGSLPVVFGHIGAVMLICQSGALGWLTSRLAAVGRMALSNYLFDSIVCTTIFYGYGFDLYGALHRPLLYAIVVSLWTFQLLISPVWLRHFRYGPAEWLWRSLTYWKWQPMLRRREPEVAPATVVLGMS